MTVNKKISELEFRNQVSRLGSVSSITGNTIYDLTINGDVLEIFRRSTQKSDKIRLKELYDFYINETEYKTTTAKIYISGRVQSPATAILLALTQKINLHYQ